MSIKQYYKKFYKGSKKSCMDIIKAKLEADEGCFVITANPEILMMGKRLPEMDKALMSKDTLLVPDGIGVIKGGAQLGVRFEERIPGVEICEELLAYADDTKKSVYLFGARREVVEALVSRIRREYRGIMVKGYSDGYVGGKDEVFKEIIGLEPDIVMVALGTPQQELLIQRHFAAVNKGIYIGVGGSFDVLSGLKQRAPSFFIRHNIEWLYRITKEPKRIKRFWDSNIKFLFELRKEKHGSGKAV